MEYIVSDMKGNSIKKHQLPERARVIAFFHTYFDLVPIRASRGRRWKEKYLVRKEDVDLLWMFHNNSTDHPMSRTMQSYVVCFVKVSHYIT